MSVNQRRSERLRVSVPTTLHIGKTLARGPTFDISLNGIFFLTREPLPVNQLVRLTVKIPDGGPPMECFGWIRHCDIERLGGAGIQFFALEKKNEERWTAFYQAQKRRLAVGRDLEAAAA